MVEPETPKARAVREHWAKITETAHDAIAGKLDARKKAVLADTLERFEADLSPHLAPLVDHLLDDPAIPEPIRNLLAEIADPQHFTGSLLIGIAVGGLISPMLGAIVAPVVDEITDQAWSRSPGMELSPAEIALGVLRHNPHLGNPYAEAATSGINSQRLDALIYNTGHGLAIEELLLLFRRGQIDQARLETGLRQSAIRDEWFPELLDLRFAPPGAGTVITGVLKGHLSEAEGRVKLQQAGIDPTNFDWMRASSGRPPGIMQMVELWNRGYVSQAKVEQAVKQSDINPDYMPDVLNLRWYHPPPRSIVPMLRHGAITEARARTLLSEHGLKAEDVDAFVKEAGHSAVSTAKELSASLVVRLYEQKLIPRADATARLGRMQYNPVDANLYLELADEQVKERALAAATTRVHSLFVHHKITRAEAQADLAKIGQPAAAITQLLGLWDEELVTNVVYPSPSAWVGAYRREIIDLARCVAEVKKAGYVGMSVKVVIADGFPAGKLPKEVFDLNPANL